MTYKELNIDSSYISKGDNNIADSFLNPVLQITKEYKRSVGFFSSSVIETIIKGLSGLIRNNGKIKLIASPRISEKDAEVIQMAYESRQEEINNVFIQNFKDEIDKLNDNVLHFLYDLIRKNILDIKIAVSDDCGIYHDKLGILKDNDNNTIVFLGSSNSSYSGYRNNYEKIRIFKDWELGTKNYVIDEENEFDSLWNNTNEFVEVYEFTESAKKSLLETISHRESAGKNRKNIVLRSYQNEAIEAWVNNNYHGFYVMATGTGKTLTALFSAKKLVEKNNSLIVICAPYKHLIKQWAEDVENIFSEAKIILVSSENPNWDNELTNAFILNKYNNDTQVIIISTIASFKTDRFNNTIEKYHGEKLLIVDEAHRFKCRPDNYDYMLGLSATPFSGRSALAGIELMNYFGGQVFNLPIEVALEKHYLVPYYYYPIFVDATAEEEERFNRLTGTILSCFKNGKCINEDLLIKTLRNRLRIISMAEEKQTNLDLILEQVEEKDHIVVYCGDGRLFDNDTGKELKHIQSVKQSLKNHGYKASQFTAQENMKERMDLVDSFNKGHISALAAIRCLDEGINIPSIKSALILSSNDDYREFVQRRGRILRTFNNKDFAKIYDVIVLPSESEQWAKIELRRFLEYAKLSQNWENLQIKLEQLLLRYNICMEDIDVFDYEDVENEYDE